MSRKKTDKNKEMHADCVSMSRQDFHGDLSQICQEILFRRFAQIVRIMFKILSEFIEYLSKEKYSLKNVSKALTERKKVGMWRFSG